MKNKTRNVLTRTFGLFLLYLGILPICSWAICYNISNFHLVLIILQVILFSVLEKVIERVHERLDD